MIPSSGPAEISEGRSDDDRARLSAWLVAAGRGDAAAFETVYQKTSAKLFGACLRIFPERAEAEDALQDAYITIWNRAAAFDPARGSAIAWLMTVARNRAIDRLRARGRHGFAPVEDAAAVADPAPLADVQLLADADARALTGCVEALEPRDADFIRSAFLRGATYLQLAERDALPLGTVKSRIRRALLKLRECLSS